MPGLAERLLIQIDAQTGGAIREFRKVGNEADKLGKASGSATKAVGGLGLQGRVSGQALRAGIGVAAGTAAVALLQFAKSGVAAQRDLQEQVAASTVVFGKNAGEVQKWAKGGATAFGQSQRAALEAANGFGTLFETLGIGSDLTAKFSQGFSQLAGDLASFKNTSIEDATQALRSGLVGEAEPLRKYGVLLNETAVKNKALELGIRGTNGVLSEQEKVFVRAQIVLEQTGKAQGDFARTSGSLANQQRVLGAQMENLSATFGRALIPLVTEGIKTLNGLAGAVQATGEKARSSGLLDVAKELGSAFVRQIPPLDAVVSILGELNKSQGDVAGSADQVSSASQKAAQAQAVYASLLFSGTSSSKELKVAQQGLAVASAAAAAEQKALAEAMQTPEQKAEAQAAAVRNLRGALLGTVDAQRSVADADRGVRDASERVSDARGRLNELLRKSKVDAKEVANAQFALTDSSRSLLRAQEDLATAQDRLNTLRRGGVAEDKDDAQRGVQSALLGVERANRRVSDAQRSLSEARASGDPLAVADAELSLREALLGVKEAEDSLEESQSQLNEVTGVGVEGARALKDAENAVRDAEWGVTSAQKAHKDAQAALNVAQQGDLTLAGQIKDAKRDVRSAEEGLAGARDAAARSLLTLNEAQAAENQLLGLGGQAASILLAQLNALVTTYPQLRPMLDSIISKVASLTAITTGDPGGSVGGKPFSQRGYRGPGRGGDGMGEGSAGGSWQSIVNAARGSGIPFAVSSTVRPGARTSTGNVSLHSLGKAVDFGGTQGNLSALFDYFSGDPAVREMFYSPKGYGLVRGRRIPNASLSGSIVKDHYDHVHVGVYHQGGVVPGSPSTESLAILRGGETVLATRNGLSDLAGPTIVINAGLGTDPTQLEEAVARAVARFYRRNPHLN